MGQLDDEASSSKAPDKVHSFSIDTGEEEINDNPIEEVRLTVPITDDPTLPALTFRTWVLGLTSCILLAFVNKFFGFRQNPLSITSVAAQIAVTPFGRLMAATLPTEPVFIPFTKWSFSLNPGPFNLKEHVLITIFANCGAGGVYAAHIIIIVKAFYKRSMHPIAAILLAQTTQLLGYGWAGLFRKYLVDSPYMWWPANLVQVSLFRTLHEKDTRTRSGGLTRLQFFIIVVITSFAYYVIPGYLFPSIGCLSILCWLWKNSMIMQQLGSGLHGLGIGAISFDWNTVVSFLGSPLSTPSSTIMNIMAGFFLFSYVVIPFAYYSNAYEAKRFPFISSKTFDYSGHTYNVSRVMDDKSFSLDENSYNNYSNLYLSIFFAFSYGLSFATLAATISHVALYHGKSICRLWKQTSGMSDEFGDVHSRLMKKNYEQVPMWWYHALLAITFGLAMLACEGFSGQLQLPWWGLILACGIAAFFTLPIGIIYATTNQQPGLNVITELIIGFLYPGRPIANVTFKTYGYISMSQGLSLLMDFKLGHYMKIPPKSMFIVQLVGTMVASLVYFSTTWWLLGTVENMCDPSNLPEGSPWTCPDDEVFYNASIIWGAIGPGRMFTNKGIYPQLNWFFLIGLLAPIPGWLLSRKYPNNKVFRHINMPIIIAATMMMPPARSINYLTWGAVGIFFNHYIYKSYRGWWARYNYILSAGLDAGIAFMGILLYFSLQAKDIFGVEWWGLPQDDYCPLAKCPMASGVQVKGCPLL